MKREGRQHGMVRSYRILPSPFNPRPDTRFVKRFESPPTAGLFAKVSSKPTNHSKFTGKCGTPRCTACHVHPACKSKDKTKGTHKLKSRDVVYNARLATWRVVDARPGLNLSGFSATQTLDRLSDHRLEDEGDEEVDDCPVSGSDSYCFSDLFRDGNELDMRRQRRKGCDDDENGVCEDDDWVSNEYDDILISEMGLHREHYQVEEDEGWFFVA